MEIINRCRESQGSATGDIPYSSQNKKTYVSGEKN